MPRRQDIQTILVIGSGPIVIGQACEFDYSGAQACKVLRDDGFRVVLVNSNPATIMTDPEFADRTYVEPVTPEFVEKVIEAERPDALLPTLGGQTGLNCAVALAESGVLDRYGVELIGAKLEVIKKGEDRKLFAEAMERIGLDVPRGGYAYSVKDAEALVADLGLPVVVRPSFTYIINQRATVTQSYGLSSKVLDSVFDINDAGAVAAFVEERFLPRKNHAGTGSKKT